MARTAQQKKVMWIVGGIFAVLAFGAFIALLAGRVFDIEGWNFSTMSGPVQVCFSDMPTREEPEPEAGSEAKATEPTTAETKVAEPEGTRFFSESCRKFCEQF